MSQSGRPRLLVVEDDPELGRLLTQACTEDGYLVQLVGAGEAAVQYAKTQAIDVMLLDVLLPGIDGIETLQRLRQNGTWAPAIVLTAMAERDQRLRGFSVGADDYVAKPFDLAELLARLRAVQRRGPTMPRAAPWRVGDVVVDEENGTITRRHLPVALTRLQFRILVELLRHAGQTMPRFQLAELAWDTDPPLDSNALDVHVAAVRRRIDGAFGTTQLRTIRGVGYRWDKSQ